MKDTQVKEDNVKLSLGGFYSASPYPSIAGDARQSIYPYPFFDVSFSGPVVSDYTVCRLENEFLSVKVLPELGGRIYSVFDKEKNKENLIMPDTVPPVMRTPSGIWLPYGVEVDIPFERSPSSLIAAEYESGIMSDGIGYIRVGRTDKFTEIRYTVTYVLSPGEKRLGIQYNVYNCSNMRRRFAVHTRIPLVFCGKNTDLLSSSDIIYDSSYTPDTFPEGGSGRDYKRLLEGKNTGRVYPASGKGVFAGYYDRENNRGLLYCENEGDSFGGASFTFGGEQMLPSEVEKTKKYAELVIYRRDINDGYEFICPKTPVFFSAWLLPLSGSGPIDYTDGRITVSLIKESKKIKASCSVFAGDPKISINATVMGVSYNFGQVSLNPGKRSELSPSPGVLTSDFLRGPVHFTVKTGGETGYFNLNRIAVSAAPAAKQHIYKEKEAGSDFSYFQAGIEWEELGNRRKAAECYKKALKINKDYLDADFALVMLEWADFNYEKCDRELKRILEKVPSHGGANYYKGLLLKDAGAHDSARKHLAVASREDDYFAAANIEIGNILSILGHYGEAERFYLRVAKKMPEHGDALCRLGYSRRKQNRKVDFEKLSASSSFCMMLYAECYFAAPEEKSTSVRDWMITVFHNDQDVYLDLAVQYIRMGAFFEAEAILEVCIEVSQKKAVSPIVYLYLSYICYQTDKQDEATEFLARGATARLDFIFPHRASTFTVLNYAIAANESNYRALALKGLLLSSKGLYSEGLECFLKSAKGVVDSVIFRNIGVILFKIKNEPDLALEYYNISADLAPLDPVLLIERDDIYRSKGQVRKGYSLLLEYYDSLKNSQPYVQRLAENAFLCGYLKRANHILRHSSLPETISVSGIEQTAMIIFSGEVRSALENENYEKAAGFMRKVFYKRRLSSGRRLLPDEISMLIHPLFSDEKAALASGEELVRSAEAFIDDLEPFFDINSPLDKIYFHALNLKLTGKKKKFSELRKKTANFLAVSAPFSMGQKNNLRTLEALFLCLERKEKKALQILQKVSRNNRYIMNPYTQAIYDRLMRKFGNKKNRGRENG
ncbi:MAG: DUF5107 domain-containing protein [Fibrobacterota bacterium]